jgi:hypothetical protein
MFKLFNNGTNCRMNSEITGRLISTLMNEMETAGSYNVNFDRSI